VDVDLSTVALDRTDPATISDKQVSNSCQFKLRSIAQRSILILFANANEHHHEYLVLPWEGRQYGEALVIFCQIYVGDRLELANDLAEFLGVIVVV
jgi:hypothetical protein